MIRLQGAVIGDALKTELGLFASRFNQAPIAQLDRARPSGGRGQWFESTWAHFFPLQNPGVGAFSCPVSKHTYREDSVFRLIPRDEQFFDMFADLAKRVTASARLLDKMFTDIENLPKHAAAIKDLEHEADHITHTVIDRIQRVFVTPFDREDIHELVQQLDEVIDMIDGAARRAGMFGIDTTQDGVRQLTGILVRATEAIEWAVTSMKQPKIVEARSREIKKLEEEGDTVYAQSVAALFRGEQNPIEVIKWKEIYETIERALDQCEDVANVLESISIKND